MYVVVIDETDPSKRERQLMKVEVDQTVGDFLSNRFEDKCESIWASKDGLPAKKDGVDITDPDTPMAVVVDTFKCNYLHLKRTRETIIPSSDKEKPCAFRILMNATRKYDKLPDERSPVNAKDRMYNDVLKMMFQNKTGFAPVQVETVGKKVVGALSDTLWYIDPFHDKLLARGIQLPNMFSSLKGYYDWKTQKKKTPMVSSEILKEHIDRMSDVLMYPWFLNSAMTEFRKNWTGLVEGLMKYYRFLDDQKHRTASHNKSTEAPIRSLTDRSVIRTVNSTTDVPKEQYKRLDEKLKETGVYEPVSLFEVEPEDRYARRKWLTDIELSFPLSIYSYQHGNYLGNLNFAWRIPEQESDRNDLKQISAIEKLKVQIPVYSTRQVRKTFIDRYSRTGLKPAVLREIHRFLTNDESAPESSSQEKIDARVVEALMDADDPELLYDLRKNNGNVKSEELEPFWKEMESFLNEKAVVHERRGAQHEYMPCAISMADLQTQIASRLPDGTRIPSLSTIRYNFWPPSPTQNIAANYTGRFKVKFAVQQRLLHAQHEDKRFAAHLFTIFKEMAVMWKDHARFISLDDKAIVPIGEPDQPLSTGVRAHNKSLAVGGRSLVALDHDFHVCGVVPSVLFSVEIPDDRRDSFYRGEVFVTLKDKTFQPSTTIRHVTESVGILRSLSGDLDLDKPLLFMYTDGGPDHRSTFWTVQLSCIIMFIALDLDMLITTRTAPMASYANPAERIMSLLNLALQNVALERPKMIEDYERKMRRNNSMTKVRNVGEKEPEFKAALLESTKDVINTLGERFGRLKWKDTPVTVHESADDASIGELANIIQILDNEDEGLSIEKLKTKKDLENFKCLKDFMERHTRERQYSFQVKKCGKRRVIYSPKKLDIQQMRVIERTQEELIYICGSPLFPDGPYSGALYVKEGQSCNSEMETTYYSDINGINTPVCFFCGDSEVITNDEIQNLQQEYGIVRPICETCFQSGKRPSVRNALKTNKRKK